MLLRREDDGDGVLAIAPARARVGVRSARARVGQRGVRAGRAVGGGLPRPPSSTTSAWPRGSRRRRCNPETGLPRSFMELALDEHLGDVVARPPASSLPQSRYAALLVSLHGTALYELRDLARAARPRTPSRVRAFMAGQRALAGRRCARRWHADGDAGAPQPAPRLDLGLAVARPAPSAGRRTKIRARADRGRRVDAGACERRHARPVAVPRAPHVALRCEGRRLAGRYRRRGGDARRAQPPRRGRRSRSRSQKDCNPTAPSSASACASGEPGGAV